MKLILSSILALAIGGLPLPTQEPDDKKPQQEEPKKQPPKPNQQPQQPDEKPKPKPDKPPKQEPAPPPKQPKPEERQQPDEKQQQKRQKEQEKQQKEQAKKEKNRPPQEQTTQPGTNKQQTSRQTAGKGQRIPQEKFRASFGREHHFRVARSAGDNRRFQYSGYWFEVVEVWPAGWSFDDDCFIEEDGDDYYLVDVIHPEIRVLVIVVSG